MERKAKETPASTKPVGKPGDERNFSKPGKAERVHPHHNLGYKGVGKKAPGADGAERTDAMISKKNPFRDHPHKGK
jgi:hypothetical protein